MLNFNEKQIYLFLLFFVLMLGTSKLLAISKQQFNYLATVDGLNPDLPADKQNKVFTQYTDHGKTINLPIKHGLVLIYATNNGQLFVLGSKTRNPLNTHSFELQASIGGTDKAKLRVPIIKSISDEVKRETDNQLSLDEFIISQQYVIHRSADYGNWSVCFIKMVALSKTTLSLDKLRLQIQRLNKVTNKHFGIYKLGSVIHAAKTTAGTKEGPNKPTTSLLNYVTMKKEKLVIFDDNAIATMFAGTNALNHLFPKSSLDIKSWL